MKQNDPNKNNVSRRNFLKLLGASLASHFLFLNFPKKSFADKIFNKPRRCWNNVSCSEPIIIDICGLPSKQGPLVLDTCFGSTANPDKCGEGNWNNIPIKDTCSDTGLPPYDLDKCGGPAFDQTVIADSCSTEVYDNDNCGQSDFTGQGTVGDSCNKTFTNLDKCGNESDLGQAISDDCFNALLFYNQDKCGQEDFSGEQIEDAACNPEGYDEDKCQETKKDECTVPTGGKDPDFCRGFDCSDAP